MSPAALPYVLLLGLLFGSTLLVSRYSLGQFAPTTYTALRLALSSAAFAVLYIRSAGRGRGRGLWPGRGLLRDGVLLGVFGTAVPMVAYVSSLQYQSAGVTALLLTTAPAITALLAQFLLPDERLTGRKIAGILLALAGAAVLVLRGESGLPSVRGSPIGYGMVMGAILIDSGMIVYTRRHCQSHDTIDLSSVRTVTAALVVWPLSLVVAGFDLSAVQPSGVAALLYATAAGTFGGLMLFLWVNQRFGATASSLASYVMPVVAAAGGVLFLGERVTPVMLGGMALIVAGIAVLNRKEAVELVG